MKRVAELRAEDFVAHLVWEYHGTSDTDAVVKPCADLAVTEADSTVLLAAAEFHLADGTAAAGFCSPADDSGLDYLQPVLFIAGRQVPLWRRGPCVDMCGQICRDIGKAAGRVFPIAWRCLVPVDGQVRDGTIAITDLGAG